ncbi:MAG: HNH endonuclease [Flavobacteriales bacterium]|nr:HNH endonuclease [Flavobacteriia bacterium]NCP06950.1 HNH endonuclease [Flavobacteriales bacterium]NCP85087.1 HNH endonuclease [Bacteroidota bacterium]PIZ05865.1 MAG: restriction endonuclease [Flavobacteriales bacterium CG_4_10_14_0_8_um_filter_32_5]NCP61494.1 HNH endonuclease [Flavobacteriales bacterium]
MERKLWSREELILVFNLYLKLPFGKMHTRTPEIIEMANLIGRTVNSIAIRLTNFAACDPYHQNRGVKGMVGGIKQCQPIWDEFFGNKELLIFESENILAEKENVTIETKFNEILFDIKDLKGETKLREVKTRVNQNVFRQIVVANYSSKCAITGIDLPELLFASHIIPWSQNEDERLNPENGICLSALYDKAFDRGLIAVNEKYKILISEKLKKKKDADYYGKYFALIENQLLIPPQRYFPKKEFIQYHLDVIFNKN